MEITNDEVWLVKDKCNKLVDEHFNLREQCSDELFNFVQPLVVASCQHALPVLASLCAGFGGLTNGAMIEMWNTGQTPVSGTHIYAGDAQQGKSRLASYTAKIISRADERLAHMLQQRLAELQASQASGQAKPPDVTLRSMGMMDFTAAEFWVRCTGNWDQVKDHAELQALFPDLPPRVWYTLLLNLDEVYAFLKTMGMMSDTKHSGQSSGCPSEHASTLNTLIGSGKIQRDTRTSGNWGGSQTASVSLQALGNIHWASLIALERGSFGSTVQAAKERVVYTAGEACKRHSDLPADFILPQGVPSRWTWLPLTGRLASSFGWSKFYRDPDAAARELTPCSPSESDEATQAEHHYVGPAGGYHVDLRDGTTLRIRFRSVANDPVLTEYRISSRWSLPSPIAPLLAAVDRTMDYFKDKPHHTIPFEEAARHLLLGCQLEQSLKATDAQSQCDSIGEAQHGQASGQIGIYAALLSVLNWAVLPTEKAPREIRIAQNDVELAEVIVRISLLIKKTAREEHHSGHVDCGPPVYRTPAHRAVQLDVDHGQFALPFNTQHDALTQVS